MSAKPWRYGYNVSILNGPTYNWGFKYMLRPQSIFEQAVTRFLQRLDILAIHCFIQVDSGAGYGDEGELRIAVGNNDRGWRFCFHLLCHSVG